MDERRFTHLLIDVTIVHRFIIYEIRLDPFINAQINGGRSTVVFHCDPGCKHRSETNISPLGQNIFSQRNARYFANDYLRDRARGHSFILHFDVTLPNVVQMLFPCPECVLSTSTVFHITTAPPTALPGTVLLMNLNEQVANATDYDDMVYDGSYDSDLDDGPNINPNGGGSSSYDDFIKRKRGATESDLEGSIIFAGTFQDGFTYWNTHNVGILK